MCGISGIFNLNEEKVSQETLHSMLSLIRHRGPDESGIVLLNNIGLGNVRLSIIDLSSGQQPMTNQDKSMWIVYNGEVFNYIELRRDLEKKGVVFQTNCDTEVVLKCYEVYGPDCLSLFNGQYAFAICDVRKKELFLARDRVGIRPLYYYNKSNRFIFGSEIKCILDHPAVENELNIESLNETFTYWTTLSPNTSFKDIRELSPGHYLKISSKGIEVKKYWNLDYNVNLKYFPKTLDEAAEELDALLEDAVRLRLRSDVPVAAYLSGGLDSSVTTYYIKKIAHQNLNTFSIGFEEKEYDESSFQNEVSNYLNTHHTSFVCSNSDILTAFPDIIWHTETPILRTAPVPMYILSKKVRENNIKVVITGEGADEMLGGYNIFKEMMIRRFWAKQPNSALRPQLLKKLYPYIPQLQTQKGSILKFFFGYKLNETSSPIYSHLLRWNNSSKIRAYISPAHTNGEFNFENKIREILPSDFDNYSDLAKAQWLETSVFMSGYLLSSQGDRMAMANSVEGRYPFLDYRVIELSTRLHPNLKINGLNEKYILKKIASGRLPERVVQRSKQAYRAPIKSVFLSKHDNTYTDFLLSPESIANSGIFDQDRINQLLKKIHSENHSEVDTMALTAILSTQILYDQFIQHKRTSPKLKNCNIINNNK